MMKANHFQVFSGSVQMDRFFSFLILISALLISIRTSVYSQVYQESDGILVMEAENTETSDWGDWSLKTNISDYSGEGHIEFDDGTFSDRSAGSELKYQFKVNEGGIYTLHLRAHKRLEGEESDKCNDAYVRMEGDFSSGSSHYSTSTLTENTKLYGGAASGWGWAENLDGNGADHVPAKYDLKAGETYTFYLVGRSVRFNVDRVVFEKSSGWETASESSREEGTSGGSSFDHIDIDNSNYRIALSHDGNAHDKDDFVASALGLAIIYHAGVKDKFVFMDYSNHIWGDEGDQPEKMRESVNGACERWGFDKSKTFEVRVPSELEAAKDAFRQAAVEAYNDGATFYYACGGPMEVPYQMVDQLDQKYRENITVITHHSWNNDHSHDGSHEWSDLIQIAGENIWIDDQNDQCWAFEDWTWLRDMGGDYEWLYNRNEKSGWDGSDAGIAYYIVTGRGNEHADMNDAKDLFQNGPPETGMPSVYFTSPSNNTQIEMGNSVDVSVSAEDSDGSISKVELYINDSLAGTKTSSPYSFTCDNFSLGNYTLKAKAYDNEDNTSTESIDIEIYDPDAVPEEFTPVDDAYTEGGNNMNDSYLKVEPDNRITYIKFNVDSLSGSEVTSAELTLSCSGDPGDGIIRVYSASDNNWTEEDITGSNSPSTSTELSSLDKSFNTGSNYTWDVTDAVSGTGEYSFILKMDSGGNDAWFSSKEGSASPVLEVTTSGSTPVTLEKSGKSRMRLISLSGMNSTGGAEARLILGSRESVSAVLYTLKGELIERVDMGTRESGEHRVVFNNEEISSGMYFLRVNAGGKSFTKSFLILK